MSANDDLAAADTVLIKSFSGTLHPPIGSDVPILQKNTCITKRQGSLNLDLPITAVPGLVLNATGSLSGSTVTWRIDHDVDVTYDSQRVTHVTGTILMSVAAMPEEAGTVCNGATPRRFTVALTSLPGSVIEISVKAFFLTVTAKVDGIAIQGAAGIA
jgi:hypothetical protein